MSLMKCTLAAVLLSAFPASADEAKKTGPIGVWKPVVSDTSYTDRTVLVFSDSGRFAAFMGSRQEATAAVSGNGNFASLPVLASRATAKSTSNTTLDKLYAGTGTWMLGEDGGEVVLAFDSHSTIQPPGSTLYVQMLLLGDELRPYPSMARRSAIAETSWRKVE